MYVLASCSCLLAGVLFKGIDTFCSIKMKRYIKLMACSLHIEIVYVLHCVMKGCLWWICLVETVPDILHTVHWNCTLLCLLPIQSYIKVHFIIKMWPLSNLAYTNKTPHNKTFNIVHSFDFALNSIRLIDKNNSSDEKKTKHKSHWLSLVLQYSTL